MVLAGLKEGNMKTTISRMTVSKNIEIVLVHRFGTYSIYLKEIGIGQRTTIMFLNDFSGTSVQRMNHLELLSSKKFLKRFRKFIFNTSNFTNRDFYWREVLNRIMFHKACITPCK